VEFSTNCLKSKTRATHNVKGEAFRMLTNTSTTFQEFHKVETRVAAYLGYNDIAEYRKFRFSTPVLRSYNLLAHYKVLSQHSRRPFSILKDVVDLDEAFGGI
jgi:hypothetical protein